ncbi:MAG: DNA-3-methyladenine glycosylase [Byssovorax sp.]
MSPSPGGGPPTEDALRHARLGRAFYARDTLVVAEDCLGKVLVHASPEGLTAGRIVEAEAYRGPDDRAAHSAGGRRTPRTEVMFGPPGHAYLFRLYGMHWAFNLVTGAEGEPQVVLIRALEPLLGLPLMATRRGLPEGARASTNGPGKLCAALGLDGAAYGLDLCGARLFLAEGPRGPVGTSPRINIDYAGEWANKPWRFFEKGNPWVSVRPRT